jgi:hypothetical protein
MAALEALDLATRAESEDLDPLAIPDSHTEAELGVCLDCNGFFKGTHDACAACTLTRAQQIHGGF